MDAECAGREIVDAAIKVHTRLGPGLLEGVYESCLARELKNRKLDVRTQVSMPLYYEGTRLDTAYRLDMLIESQIIIEVKAVEALTALHRAQLLSYLRLAGHRLGYLLNFHTLHMRDGIKRLVNGY
jgi:GxxExxY protein